MRAALYFAVTLLCSPYILCVRLLRKEATPRRVLVIQRAKIGDMVCTTPLFRSLKEQGDHVTVLGARGCLGVLIQSPDVDETISTSETMYHGLLGRLRLCLRVLQGRYDVCISVMPGGTNALLTVWSAAKVQVYTSGSTPSVLETLLRPSMSKVFLYTKHMRTFDHYMKLAQSVGAKQLPYGHYMYLSPEEQERANTWLGDNNVSPNAPFAIISVAAGNKIKEWPLERFAQVADHITQKHNMPVLISTLDTEMTAKAISLAEHTDQLVDAGGIDLRLLAAVISKASVWVSVDTGPLYMAHAFTVPLVDIIGPVDPSEQPPIPGPTVEIVAPPGIEPTSFVSETLRTSTEDQMRAIQETTVEMVTEAVDRLLQ